MVENTIQLEEADLVVGGSDGFFDNLNVERNTERGVNNHEATKRKYVTSPHMIGSHPGYMPLSLTPSAGRSSRYMTSRHEIGSHPGYMEFRNLRTGGGGRNIIVGRWRVGSGPPRRLIEQVGGGSRPPRGSNGQLGGVPGPPKRCTI